MFMFKTRFLTLFTLGVMATAVIAVTPPQPRNIVVNDARAEVPAPAAPVPAPAPNAPAPAAVPGAPAPAGDVQGSPAGASADPSAQGQGVPKPPLPVPMQNGQPDPAAVAGTAGGVVGVIGSKAPVPGSK